MDRWDEIRKLIEARHAERLADRLKELDGESRSGVAARLAELRKEQRLPIPGRAT
ncbi:hypothetical protein [Nonomuraea roseoviolacea]|uniref:hypothetical protein n=1 Tax=Nonomuraea roseoviolacea TaxID=103837 RepID=UPI0031E099FC